MARRDIEPKSVWTCDRCACEVEDRQSAVLPPDWRRWQKRTEHNQLITNYDLCVTCSNIVDLAFEQ